MVVKKNSNSSVFFHWIKPVVVIISLIKPAKIILGIFAVCVLLAFINLHFVIAEKLFSIVI